jgi:site-specific DNA recombinase
MHAVTYARFSTDRQDEASIEDQQRVCREYAAAHGLIVIAEYTDSAISGEAMGNRPGALQAISAVGAGDVLLIMDTYRLARSQDLAPLITRLRFRGVRVIGVGDHFDSASPTADMQAGFSGMMSAQLLTNIRVRTHSALKMRAQAMRATGAKPYGYTVHGDVVEHEAAIVREIFSRAAGDETLRAIAIDLNMRNVPAPGAGWERKAGATDGRWRVSALHALLSNERYLGRVVWNRSQWVKDPDSGRRIRRERPESEWIVREGARLVDDATWSKVRDRRTQRERIYGGGRGGAPRYLLSGVLTCGHCGQRMVATGSRAAYYRCSSYHHGAGCTMKASIRRDRTEKLVLAPILEDLLAPELVRMMVDLMVGWSRADRVDTAAADTSKLDMEIAELEDLVAQRPALAGPLRETLATLQERRTAAQRAAWRRASIVATLTPELAETAYRQAVGNLTGALEGSVAAARERLRRLLGDVPVSLRDGVPVAQLRMRLVALLGVSPDGSGGPVCTRDIPIPRHG